MNDADVQETRERKRPMRPNPTDKMLHWARTVAERVGTKLSDEQETDFDACKAFLDEWADKTPPSRKQAEYARRIAEQTGIALPGEVLKDYRKTSAWLDEHAGRQ